MSSFVESTSVVSFYALICSSFCATENVPLG
jgi:hypothetical protein